MRVHLGLSILGYSLDVTLSPDAPDDEPAAHDSMLDALVERAHPDDVALTAELDSRSPSRIGF